MTRTRTSGTNFDLGILHGDMWTFLSMRIILDLCMCAAFLDSISFLQTPKTIMEPFEYTVSLPAKRKRACSMHQIIMKKKYSKERSHAMIRICVLSRQCVSIPENERSSACLNGMLLGKHDLYDSSDSALHAYPKR
jgi:hypothetical protein